MATIVELGGVRPTIGNEVWLAPTAVLVGNVHVGDRASIWFGAVLRGDSSRITIGAGTSVQDNAVIHCADALPTVEKKPLSASAKGWSESAAAEYQKYRHRYLTTSVVIEGS